jgi:CheY-like chemotaxis protein
MLFSVCAKMALQKNNRTSTDRFTQLRIACRDVTASRQMPDSAAGGDVHYSSQMTEAQRGRERLEQHFSANVSLLPKHIRAVCRVKKKLRILAVDDEPIIGESIAYVLEAPHRKIAVARDGQEALTMAANEKFDVVITDHRMPRSGGLELVKKLRQRDYSGKIVVLSAYLSEEHIGTYEELNVDEIVSKPFDSAELREVIAGLEEELELL